MRDARLPRRRLLLLLAGILVWAAIILARMVQIQVYRAEDLRELAKRQHSSTVELDPVRGSILDRNGIELAMTRELKSVYAIPGLVTAPEAAAQALSKLLSVPKKKLLTRLRMKDRNFVWVARKVSDAEAKSVAALGLPGIAFLEEPKRFYPRGSLAAHVLGYVGLDNIGLAGLEQQYDLDIRGISGMKLTLRDARGLRFLPEPGGLPAEPGRNIVLTIDTALQHIVERELAAAVEQTHALAGVAIVMDPWNGDLLAMAGAPTFDPNEYARSSPAVRRNPAVQEAYEPGSTFKIMTFAAALEERKLRVSEHIDCGRGGITIAGRRINDHDPFDILTPHEIIAQSSNVGAIVVGSRLPPDDFYRHIRLFGFGSASGIELPGEAHGLLRPTRDWSALSRASISMGQEIGVTPLQLASAFAAVANGGVLVQPRIVLRVEEPDGQIVRAAEPRAVRRVIRPETARLLVEMMELVVTTGTAKSAAIAGIPVAGKTGTAQKIVGGSYAPGRYIASFVGFAPAREPRLVVLVALDEPRGGSYYGGLVAAPVARAILEPALTLLGVAAEGRRVEIDVRDYFPGPEASRSAAPGAPKVAQR